MESIKMLHEEKVCACEKGDAHEDAVAHGGALGPAPGVQLKRGRRDHMNKGFRIMMGQPQRQLTQTRGSSQTLD